MLALLSAVAHATFGALQKGRHDPWLVRGAVDFWYCVMAIPTALILFPLPDRQLALVLAGVWILHVTYKVFQAMAYTRGAFTVVYPIARGTGPLATVFFAGVVFGEVLRPGQWAGLLLLSGSIFGLALANMRDAGTDPRRLIHAIGLAFATGLMIALYTTYDAFGIRLSADPFMFLAWFFVIDGITFPFIALVRWRASPAPPDPGPLMLKGLFGALIAFVSFGGIMLATRLDKVGEAAAIRETSIIFATAIGVFIFHEKIDLRRLILIGLIACGAVLVEFG